MAVSSCLMLISRVHAYGRRAGSGMEKDSVGWMYIFLIERVCSRPGIFHLRAELVQSCKCSYESRLLLGQLLQA